MAEKVNGSLPAPVVEAVLKGEIVFYGEFRKGAAVEFSGKNNKLYHQKKYTVETGEGVITVTEFFRDNEDWTKWVCPFQKGQMVMGLTGGLETKSGAKVASASLRVVA